jgi:uncharacterized Zn finger protein
MTCIRCCGLMLEGHVLDFEGAYGQMRRTSWRCVNCGRVHDFVIEQHRQEKVLALATGEPDYPDDDVHLGASWRQF